MFVAAERDEATWGPADRLGEGELNEFVLGEFVA